MRSTFVRVVLAVLLVSLAATAAVAQDRTYTLTGTVVEVDGNTLVVKMDSGEARMFTPPADRRFVIDGQELTLSQLKPGTKLTAQVSEASSTVNERTVESLEGTVFYAAGPTVILTLPTRERRQFVVKSTDPVKFYDHNGKEITVFDLRKNMNIKATKIVEVPRTQLVTTASVTGSAPTAATQVAASSAPAAAPRATSTAAAPAAEAPKKLPKTASALPLLGLIGLASLATGAGLTAWRHRG